MFFLDKVTNTKVPTLAPLFTTIGQFRLIFQGKSQLNIMNLNPPCARGGKYLPVAPEFIALFQVTVAST